MSDMLREFVNQALDEQMAEKYAHVRHPAGVYARVVRMKQEGESYVYTVRILDAAMNVDADFPEIPGVKSDIEFVIGDVVVVLLLYGNNVYVIGRQCL